MDDARGGWVVRAVGKPGALARCDGGPAASLPNGASGCSTLRVGREGDRAARVHAASQAAPGETGLSNGVWEAAAHSPGRPLRRVRSGYFTTLTTSSGVSAASVGL